MTQWQDVYLCAPNEEALINALPWARSVDETGVEQWNTAGDGWVLDIIGTLELTPAKFNKRDKQTQPPRLAQGYHANLRCTPDVAARVPPDLCVVPDKPRRVWA